eukprot:CAMPEP_0194165250 /NCGR_PEP_ID=MMETSP0154-20130528/1225_1 /TAXON_ID=1049557 /ORGANISM="Thalassiothrix antarctica, Strain L6-D1" /LENGTH=700 /DNA_ID=CAMNT_0038875645 /DNA_START=137 /DNA_END=2236 /DNA_ORIENTATION=+
MVYFKPSIAIVKNAVLLLFSFMIANSIADVAASSSSKSDKTVIGYYASWQWYDRGGLAKPSNMDFTKVSRVNFAFFQVDSSGNIWGTDSWADPQILFGPTNWNPAPDEEKKCSWTSPTGKTCDAHKNEEGLIGLAHAAGAEIYPSLGGWTLSDAFVPMAANPVSREKFANNCVEMIQDYDFDGIDIDWEYPGYEDHSGTPDDRENYNLLLDELRTKLDALTDITGKYYGITAALPCGPSNIANIDIAHVSTKLDELNLMTYDFAGSWDNVTGVNAPIYHQGWGPDGFSLDDCVNTWLDGGGTRDQINIGMPFYGRSYGSASGLNQPFEGADMKHFSIDEGTPQYFNIVSQHGSMTSVRHEATKTQYGSFNDGSGFVSYDNEQAICDKTEYVLNENLNGFIIWELSGDLMPDLSTPLLDAVNKKLADPGMSCGQPGPPTTIPPTPMDSTPMQPAPNSPVPQPALISPAPQLAPNGPTTTQPDPTPTFTTPPQFPASSGTCGNGQVGNGVCANGSCCSSWGYCGFSTTHCGTSPPNESIEDSEDEILPSPPRITPHPIIQPAPTGPAPTESTPSPCGNGQIGNGVCSNGLCCSQWGYCGSSTKHCGSVPENPTSPPYDSIDDTDDKILPSPPRLTPQPTAMPTTSLNPDEPFALCCPSDFTGLRAYKECTQFYSCVNGVAIATPVAVPPGTLFDSQLGNFNW